MEETNPLSERSLNIPNSSRVIRIINSTTQYNTVTCSEQHRRIEAFNQRICSPILPGDKIMIRNPRLMVPGQKRIPVACNTNSIDVVNG